MQTCPVAASMPSVRESAEVEAHRERVRHRLLPPAPTDRVAGWVGALAVTALAGFLRFWQLGQPRAFVFDETYYAKDAYGLLNHGYEQDFVDKADDKILSGNLDVFSDTASYVVHPPLGKWIIATGEQIFGMNPFGWRVAVAVLGTLSVLLLARLVRRMTGSTVLGHDRGLPARHRRPASGDEPDGAARPATVVLPSGRLRCAGLRP